jgi:hypothetical protein
MALLSRFLLFASLALALVSPAASSSRGELSKPPTPYVKALHARRPSVIGGLLRVRQSCGIGESNCGVGCCDIGTSCCSGKLEQGPLCLSFNWSLHLSGQGCCPLGYVHFPLEFQRRLKCPSHIVRSVTEADAVTLVRSALAIRANAQFPHKSNAQTAMDAAVCAMFRSYFKTVSHTLCRLP